jgi:hypothetical protein
MEVFVLVDDHPVQTSLPWVEVPRAWSGSSHQVSPASGSGCTAAMGCLEVPRAGLPFSETHVQRAGRPGSGESALTAERPRL